MNKIDLLLGFVIGLLTTLLGSYLYLTLFTEFDFLNGIRAMKSQGHLGKIITLGTLLDLILFGILLKLNKELMARGVVLSVIVLTIVTLFI
jgi:hypothetical protein